jgi:hypothetical protein
MQIGKEINLLCKGDGEQPKLNYLGAVMIRAIPTVIGIITGLVMGILSSSVDIVSSSLGVVSSFLPFYLGGGKAIGVFLSIASFGAVFTLVGSVISGLYLNYWWYKQAHRLKINAYRFDISVKERGTDIFLFRTVVDKLFLPITVILFALSFLVPVLIAWLITLINTPGAYATAVIILAILAIPCMLFSGELTTGGLFSFFFIIKNLNRYADVYRNGAKPFDPMGYDYYPSVDNHYTQFLPGFVDGSYAYASAAQMDYSNYGNGGEADTGILINAASGSIDGVTGAYAGYNFILNPGEEIIIGKDAKVSGVVIDTSFREISRKHVGIIYDAARDAYRVTDYSSNGTWANGLKLQPGVETIQKRGTILKLANDKNTFRLG